MKLLFTLLLSVASGMPFSNLCAEEVTTVTLPPFTVIADLFAIDYGGKKDVVDYARVRDVTPGSKPFMAGLRDGDTLVSLFGRQVIGMKREEFETLFGRPPAPRNSKTFRFTRKRGLLRSGKIIDLTFFAPPQKPEPNQTPEPTAAAGRGSS